MIDKRELEKNHEKEFNITFNIPLYREIKNKDGSKSIPISFDVKGTLDFLKSTIFECKDITQLDDLLAEYFKFKCMDAVGIKSYPYVENDKISNEVK